MSFSPKSEADLEEAARDYVLTRDHTQEELDEFVKNCLESNEELEVMEEGAIPLYDDGLDQGKFISELWQYRDFWWHAAAEKNTPGLLAVQCGAALFLYMKGKSDRNDVNASDVTCVTEPSGQLSYVFRTQEGEEEKISLDTVRDFLREHDWAILAAIYMYRLLYFSGYVRSNVVIMAIVRLVSTPRDKELRLQPDRTMELVRYAAEDGAPLGFFYVQDVLMRDFDLIDWLIKREKK